MSAAAPNGYLLDTSVLSAFAPDKPAPSPGFAAWLQANAKLLYIPCIAVAELEQGIRKLSRAGGAARAGRLSAWLEGLIDGYAERILPLDVAACRVAGQIADKAVAAGRHPGFPDVAIAALAKQHGLRVLTRNVRHFVALGIACTDPFERLPPGTG